MQACRVVQALDEAVLYRAWLRALTPHPFHTWSADLCVDCHLFFSIVISDTVNFVQQATIRTLSVLVVHLMPKALLTDLLTLVTFKRYTTYLILAVAREKFFLCFLEILPANFAGYCFVVLLRIDLRVALAVVTSCVSRMMLFVVAARPGLSLDMLVLVQSLQLLLILLLHLRNLLEI